jgi:hypothetical protein
MAKAGSSAIARSLTPRHGKHTQNWLLAAMPLGAGELGSHFRAHSKGQRRRAPQAFGLPDD